MRQRDEENRLRREREDLRREREKLEREKQDLLKFERERQRQPYGGIGLPSVNEYSEETAQLIDREIKVIIDSQYELAKEVLTKHKKVLDEGAALVLSEENIEGNRLKELLDADKEA